MEYVRLGRRGPNVSRIGLGTMNFGSDVDAAMAHCILDRAADLGINHFDTADVYPTPIHPDHWGRSEEILGDWLQTRAESYVVSTKCLNRVGPGPNDLGGSRKHIIAACEASLRRLRRERIDVFYLMYLQSAQLNAPLDETLEALDRLADAGKILYIGVSNFEMCEIAPAMECIARGRLTPISVLQLRYNLLNRHDEQTSFPLAAAKGYGVVTYNPLAGGLLSGRYRRGQELPVSGRYSQPIYQQRYWNERTFEVVEAVAEIAREEGVTPAQVAIAWLLDNPAAIPITGARDPEQLDVTCGAATLRLSAESLARLDAVSAIFT